MKKGFIFVETMVVIAFLGTVLLTVYSSFTTVLDNAKTRLYYDDSLYLYRTYYLLAFLEENNLTDYIKDKFGPGKDASQKLISEFGCGGSEQIIQGENSKSERAFCNTMVQNWNINHIFVMPYVVNNVVECSNKSIMNNSANKSRSLACKRNTHLQSLSVQAVNYLYSLDGYTGTNSDGSDNISNFRLVVEFDIPYTQEVEYYEYVNPTNSNLDVCKSGNPRYNAAACTRCKRNPGREECKNITKVTSHKYYYTTLEIPFGENMKKET